MRLGSVLREIIAGRGAVVHQLRRLDRADHHYRDDHPVPLSSHQGPDRDHGRAGRGAVVHKHRLGRITTAGAITTYTASGINSPYGITAGPDRALWFTSNAGNSIGRITAITSKAGKAG